MDREKGKTRVSIKATKKIVWEIDEYKCNNHAEHRHALIKMLILLKRFKSKHPEEYEKDSAEADKIIIDRYFSYSGDLNPTPNRKKQNWKPMNSFDKSEKDIISDDNSYKKLN